MLLYYILCLFSFPLVMAMETFVGAIKPECQTQCGNVTVPYPFGIANGNDKSCSLDDVFFLTCNTSTEPPKLFWGEGNIQIQNISDSELRVNSGVAFTCYFQNGSVYQNVNTWINLLVSQYTFSEKNRFTVIGCDDYGLITGTSLINTKTQTDFSSGCFGLCSQQSYVADDGQCSGKGCCQTSIAKGLQRYNVELETFQNHTEVWPFNQCSFAFLGEQGTFQFRGASDLDNVEHLWKRILGTVPVVIDWVIAANKSCSEATECKDNSHCYEVENGGYRCRCNEGYSGNPYLDSGCQDIDECKDNESCYGECKNTPGSYNCNCNEGYSGNATVPYGCQPKREKQFRRSLLFYLGIGLALLAIVIGLLALYSIAEKKKLVKLREKNYEQNGGALLKEKLKTKGGVGVSSVNIFRIEELEEATDKFAESRVLGKGGNGIVYKGTLTDKRFVAIKKSQRVDQGQREDFINEMVILTQINHINVVQLIGFCLEDDVPLLAYEFVANDTLHRHIHNRTTNTKRLSWDTRLRIAHESAGALAYLHTDARMPIIHRDVKSTNILLDENYTAKIADFGASRLVTLGHDEVATLVQGTFGYLDPEFFHSGELTDKSDVYSFGVVLAELFTGQQPLNKERCLKERNLATYFVKAVKENTFLDILEKGVVNEASYEQLTAISGLVCRCLNQVGENRPSMKEVTMELDTLRKLGKGTNWVGEDNFNETSSLNIETELSEFHSILLIPKSDTFGDSSITSEMQDMMLQLKSAR